MGCLSGVAHEICARSRLSALVYQLAWLREFRLIFGTSTAASAAALGVFMGGLGLGGIFLGRRADRAPVPLALYGWLEVGIAAAAALSPVLVMLARALYLAPEARCRGAR